VALEEGAKLVLGDSKGKISNVQFLAQITFLAAPSVHDGAAGVELPYRTVRARETRRNGYRSRHPTICRVRERERRTRKENRTGG
jgi:hypothetical protein